MGFCIDPQDRERNYGKNRERLKELVRVCVCLGVDVGEQQVCECLCVCV